MISNYSLTDHLLLIQFYNIKKRPAYAGLLKNHYLSSAVNGSKAITRAILIADVSLR